MILTEQIQPAVEIVDVARAGAIMWSWYPGSSNVAANDVKWFSNIDDAKPVYNLKYVLVNASGGGVALIRTADKKAVFYAHAGSNPHSSELLPDGNIVTASSTDNRLVIFHVDTSVTANSGYRKVISLPFAHNVVWDKKRNILWAAGQNKLYKFKYNFNCTKPDLTPLDTILLPGTQAHDLFPVYGKDSLWFTNPSGTYQIALTTMDISRAETDYQQNIKSVSSGPQGWATIIQKPTEQWWTDEILDMDGGVVFRHPGWKIYKARWFVPNLFSYPENDAIKVCN